MEIPSIQEMVRTLETTDKAGETLSSKYVKISLRNDVNTTEAYLNSKHISGEKDYLGRPKPFFNIVVAARNIWFRATDIDCKHISLTATKEADNIISFLAGLLLQKWMRQVNFGKFLNDWGLSLANHGSSILKFIEKGGKLHSRVMDWNNILVDQIDFENNIKVEKLWFTPAQLLRQDYDKDLVKKLLDNLKPRQTIDGQSKDAKDDYICVYEVHGELSQELYNKSKGLEVKEGDENIFFQQMYVITLDQKKDDGDKDTGSILYVGKETRDPYMITHLIAKDGQTYAGGAVKNLFQSQWMVNHEAKTIKDLLDLSSKIFFQTSDGNFVGQNAIINAETGDFLHHALNQPVTQLNNKADISSLMNFKNDWQSNGNQINGIADAMIMQAKSGTAWRQTQAELQEAHSLFELMTQNKKLAIIDMMTDYILPFVKKQMDTTEEISEILSEQQIKWIDSKFLPNAVIEKMNEKKKNTILSGQIYDTMNEPMDTANEQASVQQGLNQMGNQRFIKPSDIDGETWKSVISDMEWEISVDIEGAETKDKQGTMATLNTYLQTIIALQGRPMTPEERFASNRLLELAGQSPLELPNQQSPQPAQPAQPTQPAMASAPSPINQMPINDFT